MRDYLRDPEKIQSKTFDRIRGLASLERFSADEKQVVLHMVRTCGEPALADMVQFSPEAVSVAKKAIKKYAGLLYDDERVKCGLDVSLLYQEPMCFVAKASVISQAKANKQTRAMTAIDQWKNYIKSSIVIFGQSGAALARLLELLKAKELDHPALVIATQSGFVNAEPAKQAMIDSYDELGVEYIVLEGTVGGSQLAGAAMNALLMIQQDIYI